MGKKTWRKIRRTHGKLANENSRGNICEGKLAREKSRGNIREGKFASEKSQLISPRPSRGIFLHTTKMNHLVSENRVGPAMIPRSVFVPGRPPNHPFNTRGAVDTGGPLPVVQTWQPADLSRAAPPRFPTPQTSRSSRSSACPRLGRTMRMEFCSNSGPGVQRPSRDTRSSALQGGYGRPRHAAHHRLPARVPLEPRWLRR